jgi:hypothetical protein
MDKYADWSGNLDTHIIGEESEADYQGYIDIDVEADERREERRLAKPIPARRSKAERKLGKFNRGHR